MLYVYGRLLFTRADIGHALLNMYPDLSLDLVSVAVMDPDLQAAVTRAELEPQDQTAWQPASRASIQQLMRFDYADADPSYLFKDGHRPIIVLPPGCEDRMYALPPFPLTQGARLSGLVERVLLAVESDGTELLRGCKGCGGGPPCAQGQSCCAGICCSTGERCCGSVCRANCETCCKGVCCPEGEECCDGVCCNDCCNKTVCCPEGEDCCGGACCPMVRTCCGTICCSSETVGCCMGACCAGTCLNEECWDESADPCVLVCDDHNPCTIDYCPDQTCLTRPVDDGTECDADGNPCTVDACQSGACVSLGQANDGAACASDGDPCTNDVCSGGVCDHPARCSLYCCGSGTCCNQPCEVCSINGTLDGSGAIITVSPATVCLGDSMTFTVSGVVDSGGIMELDCEAKTPIPPVTPDYAWTITNPDTSTTTGSGSVAAVTTTASGTYSCTFTAAANRDCPPGEIDIGPATGTAATSATLTLNPSSIPATTPWLLMPAGLSQSDITVIWNPPECEGTLEIVELEPEQGYLPAGQGTLDQLDPETWRYVAFDEPQTELCPKPVKVWIAAMRGDQELARKSVRVLPVHTWWITNPHQDFQTDYNYLVWKYATVLATTGGTFTSVTISADTCVLCPDWNPFADCVYACITDADVVFGTTTFSGSENQAASIIGHELVHTTGADECPAYQWEFDHDAATGIFQCDSQYLADVVQDLNCECNGICP